MDTTQTLRQRALSIARRRRIARAKDFRAAGIPPAYLTRLCQRGKLQRQARGLYQLADPEPKEAGHSLAEGARLVRSGGNMSLQDDAFQNLSSLSRTPHRAYPSSKSVC